MNRSTRTLLVVAIAVVLAAGATFLVYKTITSRPPKEVEVAHTFAVVATRPLSLGTLISADDVKLVPWPSSSVVPGSFDQIEAVTGRGVIAPVAQNEPISQANVASKDAGAGLPPTIPAGMRAISVRVNEVIGVAGFVVPGTRVDVMVIMRDGPGSLARVVVSDVQVLAAGTKFDQDLAKEGKAMPSSVVTLMVNPTDAQLVGLASTEGQILLTLRNPLDTSKTSADSTRTSNLAGQPAVSLAAPAPTGPARPRPQSVPVAAPAPPKIFSVEAIKAAKRSEEIIK